MNNLHSKNNIYISNCSVLLAIIMMLNSCNPWLSWDKPILIQLPVILFVLCRSLILLRGLDKNIILRYNISIVFLFIWFIWSSVRDGDDYAFFKNIIMVCLPLLFVTLMGTEEQSKLKYGFITFLALILMPSLVFYLLFILGYNLPNSIIVHPSYGLFYNYYFFVISWSLDSSIFLRFSSIFLEPGHLGMICALCLYAEKYDWKKWQNIVILISLVVTLSLAAYVLLVAGWFIFAFQDKKLGVNFIINVIAILLLFYCFELLTAKYNDGGIITNKIINRFEYDSERGIAANNRNTYDFKIWYENFSHQSEYFIGLSKEEFYKKFPYGNSSYQVFIAQYGIIGFLIMLAYFYSYLLDKHTKIGVGMFLLFFISFIQRPYWFWEAESFMYICSISLFYNGVKQVRY